MLFNAVFTHPQRLSGSREAEAGTSCTTALIWPGLLERLGPISPASRAPASLLAPDQANWIPVKGHLKTHQPA